MPKFEYTNNYTRAAVSFPAHKFPHTSSVYYQCNVRLCINNGGCDLAECNGASNNRSDGPRRKRFVGHDHQHSASLIAQKQDTQVEAPLLPEPEPLKAGPVAKGGDMSFDVYSGLYVSDLDVGGEQELLGGALNFLRTNSDQYLS